MIATSGTITGLDNVLSTGLVNDLAGLLSSEFEVPTLDEIDPSLGTTAIFDDYIETDEGEEDDDDEGTDEDGETMEGDDEESLMQQQSSTDPSLICQ
ncbi:MAG: hypothetical protein MJA83_09435 [Gammaproteobacteria bacterium]|nr:hypothetical protein [Gammaproteobacteria bacterium]